MKIVKAYTKYDSPPTRIEVPSLRPLYPSNKDDMVYIGFDNFVEWHTHTPTKVTEGLEGVKFITYEEKK